ncbi:MAG TPA: PQQ-binding-like beta-propeller repeat protein [Gemmataceae bacterium]|nr:PQQ-binding-like beta-propeller repeat protein [Gemmataceae bacterium]
MSHGAHPKAKSQRTLFRSWFPGIVVCVAGVGVAAVWSWPSAQVDFVRRVNGTILLVSAAAVFLALWSLFLSGLSWWLRLAIPLSMLAVGVLVIRDVKFTGDMVPLVEFRWLRNRDAILEAHRQHQAAALVTGPVERAGSSESDFPAYRGRQRDGIVHGPALARDWKAQPPHLLWRQPVGGGYAAFAVAGNVAVTIEQRRDREAVVCYDVASGRERWVHDYPAHFTESLGGDGPRATPTIAEDAVYSLGATGRLVCLDLNTGQRRWEVDILAENDDLPWGMSGSPLVCDRMVIVNPGVQRSTAAGRAVVAYDCATGRQVWQTGKTKAGYSSPMLAQLAGRRQLLLLDGEILAGYDPQTGKELWRFPWETYQEINVAQPIVLEGDRIFISSGYDKGCAMLRLTESAGQGNVQIVWQNRNMRCKFTSPVAYKGFLYGLDEGILACIHQETGARKWRDGRYGHGQLLLADDLLVILSETGKLVLVEATPEGHRELGSITALEGKTWNNPALAGGKAFIRNSEEMACYDLAARRGKAENLMKIPPVP